MEYVCFVEGTLFVPRPLKFVTTKKEVINTWCSADCRTTGMEKFIPRTVDRKLRRVMKRQTTKSRRYNGRLESLRKAMTSESRTKLSLTTAPRMAWRTKRQDSVLKVTVRYSKFCVTMWQAITSNRVLKEPSKGVIMGVHFLLACFRGILYLLYPSS